MKYIKKILKNLRLSINRLGSKKRSQKLVIKNPTIISNNCYAGITYEYLGIKFASPTIGLYFFADEYIKFCSNLKYYVSQKMNFIEPTESKYYEELKKKKHDKSIIGKLGDIEIVFLHYKTEDEAREKWEKRCRRINYDCLIFKFCDQNLCTYENIRAFDALPYKNKICFTTKEYPEFPSVVCFKNQHNKQEVVRDYYVQHKYFDIISFINNTKADISTNSESMPIRVLQVGMTYSLGGIENFLINYYRHIDKSKVQFDFINIYDKDLCFQKEILELGGRIYSVPNYYKKPIKFIKEMIKIIQINKYTIVHCNMNSAVMLYPLIAAKIAKAKLIIAHSHNSSSDKGLLKTILHNVFKYLIPMFANTFFACSNTAGEWFYSKKIRASNSYHVINNAIDLKSFSFKKSVRDRIRKEFGIASDELVVGNVGRFNTQKNHTFILDVFNDLHKKNKNSRLVLVGNGPLKNDIVKKAQLLNIEDSIIFLENRDDVNELMQMMDVFLLPSLYEGLPLVGVEAQAVGTKCFFSSDITKEVKLLDSTTYIPLNKGSEYWAESILDSSDEVERKEAYNKVRSLGFDIEHASKKLVQIYLEGGNRSDKGKEKA